MKKEAAVQKEILDYLKSKGHYVVKTIATNKKGTSDIIGCSSEGTFFAIEVKATGKKDQVSALQVFTIGEIKKRKGLARVADCVSDVVEMGL